MSLHFFHTIAINFIMTFLKELNFLFIVIDKFSWQVALIAEKSMYSASQWANLLMNRLQNVN